MAIVAQILNQKHESHSTLTKFAQDGIAARESAFEPLR